MTVPVNERYFEDYQVGETLEFGDYHVTETEIIEFASKYDPQSFHIDPEAAGRSIYGGIIASGWMTGSIMMRLMADFYISPRASMGSPGVDELRWLRPVRPGDRLHVRMNILSTRRSNSKPDRGIVESLSQALNQNDEVVMSFRSMLLTRCRSAH